MPKQNSFANSNAKAKGINTHGSKRAMGYIPSLPQQASGE